MPKLENIMLEKADDLTTLKLIDFGFARSLEGEEINEASNHSLNNAITSNLSQIPVRLRLALFTPSIFQV